MKQMEYVRGFFAGPDIGRRIHCSFFACLLVMMTVPLSATFSVQAAEPARFTVFPAKPDSLLILKNGNVYLKVGLSGWGPKWSWMGFRGKVTGNAAGSVIENSAVVRQTRARINIKTRISKPSARQLVMDFTARTDKDTALTYIVVTINFSKSAFAGTRGRAVMADGKSALVALPLGRNGMGKQVETVTIKDKGSGVLRLGLSPAADIPSDRDARIVLVPSMFKAAGPRALKLTIDLPGDITFYPSAAMVPDPAGYDKWFEFKPGEQHDAPSEISMADWSQEPAGAHGRVTRKGEDLFYNGRRLKLWGLNLCYSSGCCPEKKLADRRAAFYRKYGVNTVRLHKFADGPGWAGILSMESCTRFDPAALERMDYQVARFRQAGIFIELSTSFGSQAIGPADCERVPYWNEFLGGKRGKKRRAGKRRKPGKRYLKTGAGTIYLSRELQDLKIEQMLNLLKHRNPHTGLTYAEDPAVAFIELINEESALFGGTMAQLQRRPTLRKRGAEMFFTWLKARYGTKEKLLAAWGGKAIGSFGYEHLTDEGWEQGRIIPAGNPWYWDPMQLSGSQKFRRQRLLDTMRFLYELQNRFYARFVKAIRAAGYTGEIVASNWQAGKAYSHYSNLHSDYLVGTIDRHNYFGGGNTMLRIPGCGILSAGMMQVADRPFMLSEWIHVWPNPWGAEGPAIIGAYGMGLQGWDVSFMFQNRDQGTFSTELGKQQWDVTAPQVMALFPAISRQVRRMDASESKLVAPRYVHVPSLVKGRLGFQDKTSLQYDIKFYDSDKVPARVLAVARSLVEFTETYKETPVFDLEPHTRNGNLVSSTNELCWHPGDERRFSGYFTLNSPGTKAVVGFARDRECELGEVVIKPISRFSAIYLTARAQDRTLAADNRLLVVAVARARNTGMKVAADTLLLTKGKGPVLLEPVKAKIRLRRPGAFKVIVLDHAGRRTGKLLPVQENTFTIDGAQTGSCYYLVEYE